MVGIQNVTRKKGYTRYCTNNFYGIKTKDPIKVCGVLSCFLYYTAENYVFIDYLCCKSKKLSSISSDKIF